jgi:acyl carrier protein
MSQAEEQVGQEETIFDRIAEVIADEFEISREQITLESDILVDLGGDSVRRAGLIISLEDEFGLDIPDDDPIVDAQTVGEVVKGIEELLHQKQATIFLAKNPPPNGKLRQ